MEYYDQVLPWLFLLAGGLNLYFSIRFILDENWGRNYIETSYRARFWRAILGEDRAYRITKVVFAPLGIVTGVGFLGYGVYMLIF
jgi:hypothetical protein